MKQMFSWNSLAFCMIHQMLAICSLVPLPFYKPRLYISKFPVHVLLKPCLKDFEHNLTSVWNECNYTVVWTFLALSLFGIGKKNDLFQSCDHCWVFQICWHVECSTLAAASFRIFNSSAGIFHLHLLCSYTVLIYSIYLLVYLIVKKCFLIRNNF